jgi:AcrR family transcriptional regulator
MKRVRRVNLRTEVRREQIVQAVLALMANQDVHSLSIAAIARRLGLVPSALYRHFAGKDEMLDAVVTYLRSRFMANVVRSRTEETNALARLGRLLQLHILLIKENPGLPRLIFGDLVHAGQAGNGARALELIRMFLGVLTEMVREGQAAGEVRKDLAPETIALLMIGVIQPAAMLFVMSGGAFDLQRHAQQGWQVLAESLASGASSSKIVNAKSQKVRGD